MLSLPSLCAQKMQWYQKPTLRVCRRCRGHERPIDGRPTTEIKVGNATLEVVDSFCYLGDKLESGGGCVRAIIARCGVAWGKFRQLRPVLTSRHLSLETRDKLYNACVRSTMLHGSEI